jgi:hypothetical protein
MLWQVYDGQDADLKLNDVVEVFGVLTFDPELSTASFYQNGVENDAMDVVGSAFLGDNVSLRLPASKVKYQFDAGGLSILLSLWQ